MTKCLADVLNRVDVVNPQVMAVDPDESGNVLMKYSLAGSHTKQHADAFSIDSNGKVYLKKGLDRDYPNGHANWQINVVADVAAGGGGKHGYGVLNLKLKDKNDNKPVFDTCCIEGSVPEHSDPGMLSEVWV